MARLVELIGQAAEPPNARIPTKLTRASQQRRLASKRYRSAVKHLRRATAGSEE